MRKRVHLLIGAGLAGLVLLLGAGIWLLFAEPWKPHVRLPGGTVAILEAATYGTEHTFDRRRWWERLQPPRTRIHTTQTDALVFWVRRELRPGRVTGFEPAAMDEHGCRFGRSRTFFQESSIRPGRRTSFEGQEFYTFPRRGSTVYLGFYHASTGVRFQALPGPNLAPGPYPVWTPEPYPIVRRRGDLEFRLDGLLHRENRRPAGARFRVFRNGRPDPGWHAGSVTVSDATGNVLTVPPLLNPDGITWFGGLCRAETAWKLRVEFAPTDPPERVAAWSWTVRGLEIPPRGETRSCSHSIRRDGMTFRVTRIAAGDPVTPPRGQRPTEARASVYVEAVPDEGTGKRDRGCWLVLLGGRDDRGRPVRVERSGPARPIRAFSVRFPADARRLDLMFGGVRTEVVELLAKP